MIRKRGNSWQVVVYGGKDPLSGQKRQISRSAPTEPEARRLERSLLSEKDAGRKLTSTATVAELLDRWFDLAVTEWSPTTAVSTRGYIDGLIKPALGRVRLRSLRPAEIDGFYGELRRRGRRDGAPLAASSVRRIHVVLHAALEQAVRWEWIGSNPAARGRATPPKVSPTEISPPTPDAVVRLLAAAELEEPALAMFLRLSAVTGARRSELCALTWADVDLPAGRVKIRRAVVDGPNGIVVKDTKAHLAHRNCLDGDSVAALESHRVRMAEQCFGFGAALAPTAFIFSYAPDCTEPWRPDGVTHRFGRVRAATGLEGVRLHDLRHYVGTQLSDASLPTKTIQGVLGHRRMSTTSDIYMHPIEESTRLAAEVLGDLLKSG